ncbi:uncharacterized protein LOC126742849 [Anthonomus grandis grandis]|uniref:uncharacterized protein LOC126742849 n=1 Tax=Anthonomus grandis grandis TaxID=2921223 RepID=UPI002164FB45|nr:uncharacterized protein LOC126742849 [Anthonomus grandis grandis]
MANTALAETKNPVTPKFITPPFFDPSLDLPIIFLSKYEKTALNNGWNDAYKISYLGNFLESPANFWYRDYSSNERNKPKTWEEIKEDFIREYSGDQPLRKIKFRLNTRKQAENEDIKKYYYDIVSLCHEVDPKMTFETFRDYFEKGLHPSYYETYYLMSSNELDHQQLKTLGVVPKRSRTTPLERAEGVVLYSGAKAHQILSVNGLINKVNKIDIILDTGSSQSLRFRKKFNCSRRRKIRTLGTSRVDIRIGELAGHVMVFVVDNLSKPLILGTDFLSKTQANIDYEKDEREEEQVTLADHKISHIRDTHIKAQLMELLEEFEDVFSKSPKYMGQTDLVEHDIDIGDSQPIKFSPFMLVYGREPILPIEATLMPPPNPQDSSEIRDKALLLRNLAVQNIQRRQGIDKLRYDTKHRHIEYAVGDQDDTWRRQTCRRSRRGAGDNAMNVAASPPYGPDPDAEDILCSETT